MKRSGLSTEKRVRAMREAFDGSFAMQAEVAPTLDSYLAVRLGRRAHALPVREIGGLFARKPITRLPTAEPALLGIAHFRGTIAPVYDLQLLLGHAPADNPGWLVIASTAPVAFAFSRFEGHVRVAQQDIVTDESGGKGEPQQQSIRANGSLLPIVHLDTIIGTIGKRMPTA